MKHNTMTQGNVLTCDLQVTALSSNKPAVPSSLKDCFATRELVMSNWSMTHLYMYVIIHKPTYP